jgi:hypothetical protein
VVADPRTAGDTPRRKALVALAVGSAEAPWRLGPADLARAREAGLTDLEVVHAIALTGLFGHLNRIADAVEIDLDYEVVVGVPRAADQPPWPLADEILDAPRGALSIDLLDGAPAVLAAWREHVMTGDRPLPVEDRVSIVRLVARMLGDNAGPIDESTLGPGLANIVRVGVTRPWALGEALMAARDRFEPGALFDIAAATASATAWSRIDVALRALSR